MWVPQVHALKGEVLVCAPDLPGHGRLSDRAFTLESAVDRTAEAIASQSTTGKAVTVGLSLGGYVAIAHAARYPEQVAGMVLSGCCVQYFGLIGFLARVSVLVLRWTSPHRFEATQRKILSRCTSPKMVEALADAGFSVRGGRQGMEAVIGRDFLAMLKWVQAPVLIVNGERDWLNRRQERRLLDLPKDVEHTVVKGAGHLCSLEQPAVFTDAVRQFARRTFSGVTPDA